MTQLVERYEFNFTCGGHSGRSEAVLDGKVGKAKALQGGRWRIHEEQVEGEGPESL